MTNMEANIPCPHCRKSFCVPFNRISPGGICVCPDCGASVKFAGQDASKVQQVIDQLTRQVENVSVKVTVKTSVRRPWWKLWGG